MLEWNPLTEGIIDEPAAAAELQPAAVHVSCVIEIPSDPTDSDHSNCIQIK